MRPQIHGEKRCYGNLSAPTDLYHPHSLGREPGYPILARSFVVVLEFLGVHSGRYQNGGSKKQKKKRKKKERHTVPRSPPFLFLLVLRVGVFGTREVGGRATR